MDTPYEHTLYLRHQCVCVHLIADMTMLPSLDTSQRLSSRATTYKRPLQSTKQKLPNVHETRRESDVVKLSARLDVA